MKEIGVFTLLLLLFVQKHFFCRLHLQGDITTIFIFAASIFGVEKHRAASSLMEEDILRNNIQWYLYHLPEINGFQVKTEVGGLGRMGLHSHPLLRAMYILEDLPSISVVRHRLYPCYILKMASFWMGWEMASAWAETMGRNEAHIS